MADLDFATAYEQHATFVWRTARRLGVRTADVDDVTQEVFVVAHRRWHTFEGRSALRTWLFGICRRVVADYRCRAWVVREVLGAGVPERAVKPKGPLAVALRQARAQLDALLEELDANKRTTFVLFELEELPMQEVAELTAVPMQTAYARLYAARRQIERALAKREPAPEWVAATA